MAASSLKYNTAVLLLLLLFVASAVSALETATRPSKQLSRKRKHAGDDVPFATAADLLQAMLSSQRTIRHHRRALKKVDPVDYEELEQDLIRELQKTMRDWRHDRRDYEKLIREDPMETEGNVCQLCKVHG